MTTDLKALRGLAFGWSPPVGTQFGAPSDIYLVLVMIIMFLTMLAIAIMARTYLGAAS